MGKRPSYLLACLIAAVTAILYLPALRNGFVIWDDDLYILNNRHIMKFGTDLLRWAFTDVSVNYWHPLTWISHAVDYAFWGLNPAGHHLTSIVLHALNTFLVVLLIIKLAETSNNLRETTGSRPVLSVRDMAILAGTAGLLFGIHPLHVESAAWVSERKDLICAFFYLASVSAYIGYTARRSRIIEGSPDGVTVPPIGRLTAVSGQYALSLVLFTLALASKPMAVTIPFVLLIIDWHPFGRLRSLRSTAIVLAEKAPFMVLSLVIALMTISGQRESGAIISLSEVSLPARTLMAAKAVVTYLWKMVAPFDLLPLYPIPANASFRSISYVIAAVLICAATVTLLIITKKMKTPLAAWAYYLVTLAPVLGIVQVGAVSMADRFTYLPSLGPFLLFGLGAALAWRKADLLRQGGAAVKMCMTAFAIAIVIALSHLVLKQISFWNNTIDLWTHEIEREPLRVPTAYFNRGLAFGRKGEIGRALDDFTMAITLSPDYADAYMNRGVAFGMTGQYTEAIADLDTAVRLMPTSIQARMNRAFAYESSQMPGRAIDDYTAVIEMNPAYSEAYLDRGRVSLGLGCEGDALRDFSKACETGSQDGCISFRSMTALGEKKNCR